MDDNLPRAFTLTRTGTNPLAFEGIVRASESSEFIQAKKETPNPHVWTITVYELIDRPISKIGVTEKILQKIERQKAASHHVVQIDYKKTFKGVTFEHHFAALTSDLAKTIAEYDPLQVLAGYPADASFAVLQKDLENESLRQFQELVSNALSHFSERI